MILKNAWKAAFCVGLLTGAALSSAAEYRPGEFLGLDLSKAVLSPQPLGPPALFVPVPNKADSGSPVAQVRAEPKPVASSVVRKPRLAERTAKPRDAARIKLTRRHGNPLDAQASDTRIQVWPCKTGGICDWQR